MASLAVRRAGSAPASTSLGRAGGAPYDTSGGCVLGAGTPLTRRPARRLRRPGLRPVRMPHRLHLQHGRARRHQAVTVLHRPGPGPVVTRSTPSGLDEVGVLCLRATRQAGIPGDRVAGLDAGGVPAGIALARGDLELALGEADRAALVVARPSARGALRAYPARARPAPARSCCPAGSPPARPARSGAPGPAARAAPAAAGPRRRTGWRRRAGRRAAPPPPP